MSDDKTLELVLFDEEENIFTFIKLSFSVPFKNLYFPKVDAFLPSGYSSRNPRYYKNPNTFGHDLKLGHFHLEPEQAEILRHQIEFLITSLYASNSFDLLSNRFAGEKINEIAKTVGDLKCQDIVSDLIELVVTPVAVVGNITQYIFTDIENTTLSERFGDVGRTLGPIILWNGGISEYYSPESKIKNGISKFQELLVGSLPEIMIDVSPPLVNIEARMASIGFFTKSQREFFVDQLRDVTLNIAINTALDKANSTNSTNLKLVMNNFFNGTNTTEFGDFKAGDIIPQLKPGRLLLKAGKKYGGLIDDYKTLVKLQKDVQSLKRKNSYESWLMEQLRKSRDVKTSGNSSKDLDLGRNSSRTRGPNFGINNPIVNELLGFLENLQICFLVAETTTIIFTEESLLYLRMMLPFRNLQGFEDLLRLYRESQQFDATIQKMKLLGLGFVRNDSSINPIIFFNLLSWGEFYVSKKLINCSDLSLASKSLISLLVLNYILVFRKFNNTLVFNSTNVTEIAKSIVKYEIGEINRLTNLTGKIPENLKEILAEKIVNVQRIIPGFREDKIFKSIFPNKQTQLLILKYYKWEKLKKFIARCELKMSKNSKSSISEIERPIKNKVTRKILKKLKESEPIFLSVSGYLVLFMIQYSLVESSIIPTSIIPTSLNSLKLICKPLNYEENPIILIAKLSLAEQLSKISNCVVSSNVDQIDKVIDLSIETIEVPFFEEIEATQGQSGIYKKVKDVILNRIKTK